MNSTKRRTHGGQDEPREHSGRQQPGDAMARDDRRQHDDERRGGAGHLELGASTDRRDAARDHGGVQAMLRRHSRGDRQGHGERQRHDADHQAREQIGAQRRPAVARLERPAHRHRQRKRLGRRRLRRPLPQPFAPSAHRRHHQ
jgi:hypothetical protein